MQRTLEILDYGLLVAVILAGIYLAGPRIRRFLRRRENVARSAGGGIAAAYVFLHLFPEIEASHEWLGDAIHFVILVSFLVFFGLEQMLWRRSEAAANSHSSQVFWMHIALSWLYTWTIVFALPAGVAENLVIALLGSAAIGLHLVYKDYVLRSHHPDDYEFAGRYVLTLAPLAGWLVRVLTAPSEPVSDLSMALLAGFLLQNVFRNELPGYEHSRYGWFVVGVATYAALVLLTP